MKVDYSRDIPTGTFRSRPYQPFLGEKHHRRHVLKRNTIPALSGEKHHTSPCLERHHISTCLERCNIPALFRRETPFQPFFGEKHHPDISLETSTTPALFLERSTIPENSD